ncbi:MAG: coproporphyrinogen III oxidase [Sulfurovum sp.]|nr:MAG: coproporphyrinogen III oxidase [Sulfurovum sp.]
MKHLIIKTIEKYARYKIEQNLNLEYREHTLYPVAEKDKKYLLYLHIPFCKVFCPYCSFHKYSFEEEKAREYFGILRKEIRLAKEKGFEFSSVYIGGGTPTILPEELAETIDLCRELFDIKELSCEADPDISDELIELLKDRVDRLSVGIQSLDDKRLAQTKRCEKFGTAQEQMDNIKKLIENFKIVNCDLIFNFPDQTKEDVLEDIRKLKELSPQQISMYPLMYSPSVKKDIEKNMGEIANTKEYELYKVIMDELSQGYVQNTCWAFSKEGITLIDEYVVDHDEYLGLGSGAFGFINETLYINTFALDEYKKTVDSGQFSTARYKKYTKKEILNYRLMVEMFGFSFSMDKLVKKYGKSAKRTLMLKTFLFRIFKIADKDQNLTVFGKYIFLIFMKEFYIGMDLVRETSRKGIDRFGFVKKM